MTATVQPIRPRAAHRRPPRYRWVPIFAAVLLIGGLLRGAAMYYLATN